MSDRLSIYNSALADLGERPLSALTEEGPSRRALDAQWDGAVRFVLEEGQWSHATRAVEIAPDPDVTVNIGFQYAFPLPSDFVRLTAISADPTFSEPLTGYEKEAGTIFANVDPLYLRYVSSGAGYGGNVSGWPMTFCEALAAYLAFKSAMSITQSGQTRNDMFALFKERMANARSKDALEKPFRRMSRGSFARGRSGGAWWTDGRR